MIRTTDLGPLLQLRWGVTREQPGRKPQLIAAFAKETEAEAYAITRRRAEERVSGRREMRRTG